MKITNNMYSNLVKTTVEKTNVNNNFKKSLEKVISKEDDKKLLDAAKQFESVFINQMMSQMRSTVPTDGLFEQDAGENIYKGMLDEEYSKQMSDAGGIGLAQMLYDQLKQKVIGNK